MFQQQVYVYERKSQKIILKITLNMTMAMLKIIRRVQKLKTKKQTIFIVTLITWSFQLKKNYRTLSPQNYIVLSPSLLYMTYDKVILGSRLAYFTQRHDVVTVSVAYLKFVLYKIPFKVHAIQCNKDTTTMPLVIHPHAHVLLSCDRVSIE